MSHPIAIVTGASSGIGAACAQLLGKKGWAVVLMGRDKSRLEKQAALLTTPRATIAGDIRSPETLSSLMRLLDQTDWAKRELKALVNNAGIYNPLAFSDTDDNYWLELFETNFLSAVRLTRALLPRFADDSSITNVSSTLGLKPIARTSAYSATKAAMNNWTQTLALELAPRIRVNCVCPGLVDTPIHSIHGIPENERERQVAHRAQPMMRMGQPEDIAAMIEFLTSKASAWTTGSVISVDGGIGLV